MRRPDRRPAWWQLYLLCPGMIGLLALGARVALSDRGHEVAALAVLVLGFALIELWLRRNSTALLHSGEVGLVRKPDPDGNDALDARNTAILVFWPELEEEHTPPPADEPLGGRETRQ